LAQVVIGDARIDIRARRRTSRGRAGPDRLAHRIRMGCWIDQGSSRTTGAPIVDRIASRYLVLALPFRVRISRWQTAQGIGR
jgi:hypothetical protein